MLGIYARSFDTVEADNSYYRVPALDLARRWADNTPASFVMATKLARTCFLGDDARELDAGRILRAEDFAASLTATDAALAELGDKAGPVVLQLPYLKREIFRDLSEFLSRLDPFLAALPKGRRYAVEVRNPPFLHDELTAILRKHRAALVLAEVRGMPHPADVVERLDVHTTDWWYARLIGDRTAVDKLTETFDRVVIDRSASLKRWAHLIATMATEGDGFVYANNHFEGHGPATVQRLREVIAAGG